MRYYPTLGLEIHAELKTATKVFCTCSAEFGGEPNTRSCPVCSGYPGMLPVLNRKAVEYIVKAGYVTNCEIARFTKWDRKNYFYPDLPKAYQISQMARPVCTNGWLEVEVGGETKKIRINRIHLEEDAGKLVHDDARRISLADYNRSSVPLIEIVTEPDIHSAEEAIAFFEKVRMLLMYAGICDGKLEQGSMRCDVNISLAPEGSDILGTRTEIKNLNSVRSITRAIECEMARQEEILDNGGRVIQQTMRFNDVYGETTPLRSKEDAHDYRYFPDPDIPPVIITEEELAEIKASLPELPEALEKRFVGEFGLSEQDAGIIVSDKAVCDFYLKALEYYDNPKSVGSFIVVELLRRIKLGEADMDSLKFGAEDFAKLVEMADKQQISKNNAKAAFRIMVESGEKPEKISDDNNFWIKEDNELLEKTIDEVIAANPKAVEQFRGGDQKVLGFLIGQANRTLKGAATPQSIQECLRKKLG